MNSMTPSARKELKRLFWVFLGSIAFTPLLLWAFVIFVLGNDHNFTTEYMDIYRAMFSLSDDTLGSWLVVLVPVVLYQLVVTCIHYCRHPEDLRSVFEFPRRRR